MKNPILAALRFADSQKGRPLSILPFLIIAIFVGFVRCLEEAFFFNGKIAFEIVIGFSFFYLTLSLCLIAGLALINNFQNLRLANGVLPGISLGMFPPIIDFVFSNSEQPIRYSYYQVQSLGYVPWLFYDPILGFPLGECSTVWLAILFAAIYAFRITRSPIRAFFSGIWAYAIIFALLVVVPALTAGQNNFSLTEPSRLSAYQSKIAQISTYDIVTVQAFIASAAVLFLQPRFLLECFAKILHIIPFALLTALGGLLISPLSQRAITCVGLTAYTFMHWLLINNYADRVADMEVGRRTYATKFASDASVATIMGFSLWYGYNGRMEGFCYGMIVLLTLAYSSETMRAKRHFFSAMKIESAWAFFSILAGVLAFPQSAFRPPVLMTVVVISAGFGVVSLWRDYKDIDADEKAGFKTLYIILLRMTNNLSRVRVIVNWIIIPLLVLPLIVVWPLTLPLGAKLLTSLSLIFLVFLVHFDKMLKTFNPVLFCLNVYLLGLVWAMDSLIDQGKWIF